MKSIISIGILACVVWLSTGESAGPGHEINSTATRGQEASTLADDPTEAIWAIKARTRAYAAVPSSSARFVTELQDQLLAVAIIPRFLQV
jgi:hypothetical protein